MFENIPAKAQDALEWGWDDFAPYGNDLLNRDLNADTLEGWLTDWSKLSALAYEVGSRLFIATTVDTTDKAAQERYFAFLETEERLTALNTQIQQKLLNTGLQPDNWDIPLRKIRADVALFREENLPLITQLQKLGNQYDEIAGAQTVMWNGEERTRQQMAIHLMDSDRHMREKAWRAVYDRSLQDREAFNALWIEMLELRQQIAANADMPDFRAYQWQVFGRHDYTPEDNVKFLESIEQVAVPAMQRQIEQRRTELGFESLRPWDMHLDPSGKPALQPFTTAAEMIAGVGTIFDNLDPELAAFYQRMRDDHTLDLDNRKGKAPGGYCDGFPVDGGSFIFMNATGLHDDVQTLLHESGHAFHNFEANKLPYFQQEDYPTEFAEVASMSMELLAAPYFEKDMGGFYTPEDAARARLEHLQTLIYFWCYMAVVDGFQHWVYTHIDEAKDTANCDAKWTELWQRYLPGVDWSGLEDVLATGWHRKLHIFQIPFYYLEYGLAQLGATQVWRNSLTDAKQALTDYRAGLRLGGTRTLPELFAAAGAKLAFDPDTLGESVALIEKTIEDMEAQLR